jgi:hypothetical protein
MMESTEHNASQRPEVIAADAGYWDTEAVQQATVARSYLFHPIGLRP